MSNKLFNILATLTVVTALMVAGVVHYTLLVVDRPVEHKQDEDIPQSVRQAAQAVFRISIGNIGTCSGTVVGTNLMVTAHHCVPKQQSVISATDPNNISIVNSVVMHIKNKNITLNPEYVYTIDVAVLSGQLASLPKVTIDNVSGDIYKVDEAVLCGYPLFSEELRCVRAKHVGNQGFASVFDTVAIPGQSGGAVFDLSGKLIGIIHSVTPEGYTAAASTAGVLAEAQAQANKK